MKTKNILPILAIVFALMSSRLFADYNGHWTGWHLTGGSGWNDHCYWGGEGATECEGDCQYEVVYQRDCEWSGDECEVGSWEMDGPYTTQTSGCSTTCDCNYPS